ncbi:hypothetical protein Aab01nite_22600 [Paractinoplanes abujensis]|nr:hypothetical protein Aab01nite_22600 [Actinoplanes abujensis]
MRTDTPTTGTSTPTVTISHGGTPLSSVDVDETPFGAGFCSGVPVGDRDGSARGLASRLRLGRGRDQRAVTHDRPSVATSSRNAPRVTTVVYITKRSAIP